MTDDTRLSTIDEPRAIARTFAPLESLALMSDSEFAQRLASVQKSQERLAVIQRTIMAPDVDYGVIPGTGNKPTLLKSGAEKLAKFHHLVATFDTKTLLGDGATTPSIRIITTCSLHYESDAGPVVGQGHGTANSWEKKYRYRTAQRECPACHAHAIFRSKFPDRNTGELGWYCHAKAGGCGAQFGEKDKAITDQQQGQVDNPDPFDSENTLIKMAAKRAYVDATLRATATSGLFTQDVEDMDIAGEAKPAATATAQRPAPVQQQMPPAQSRQATAPPPQEQAPPRTANGSGPSALPQRAAIKRLLHQQSGGTLSEDDMDEQAKAIYGVAIAELTQGQAAAFISELQKKP